MSDHRKVYIIGAGNTSKVLLSSALVSLGGTIVFADVPAELVTESDIIGCCNDLQGAFDYPMSTDALKSFDSSISKFNQLPENQTYVPKVNRKTKRW